MRLLYCNATYVNSDVELVKGLYSNNRLAIQMFDPITGEPVATVTVNVPEANLEADEIIVKNYSENEGIDDWLVNEGLVEENSKLISVGRVHVPIFKMTDKLKTILDTEDG